MCFVCRDGGIRLCRDAFACPLFPCEKADSGMNKFGRASDGMNVNLCSRDHLLQSSSVRSFGGNEFRLIRELALAFVEVRQLRAVRRSESAQAGRKTNTEAGEGRK